MAKQYKSLHPAKYYRDHLSHGIRPDGRELDHFRPVMINVNSFATADGSAVAKVGDTIVVCGVKAELCPPKAEKPDDGFLIPNIELSPLCSPKFRPGPPSEQAQISTRLIADIIENSGCISLKDLCIAKEKLVWCLYVDLICLNLDGALIDACILALIAALKTVKLPQIDYDADLDEKTINEVKRPLNVQSVPVSTTFAIFEENIITDPTQEEENLATSLITIVVKDNELCSVHKPGGSPISDEKLFNCIEQTKKHSFLLNELIEAAITIKKKV